MWHYVKFLLDSSVKIKIFYIDCVFSLNFYGTKIDQNMYLDSKDQAMQKLSAQQVVENLRKDFHSASMPVEH
jgi:hypothetical protein